MSEGVVVALEVIKIEHHEGEGPPCAAFRNDAEGLIAGRAGLQQTAYRGSGSSFGDILERNGRDTRY